MDEHTSFLILIPAGISTIIEVSVNPNLELEKCFKKIKCTEYIIIEINIMFMFLFLVMEVEENLKTGIVLEWHPCETGGRKQISAKG